MSWFSDFVKAARGVQRFQAQPAEQRQVVFYAEDTASRVHFEPLLAELGGKRGRSLSYLTSAAHDPILETPPPGVHPFYIGEGMARTYLFQALEARIMVLTMPDLETYFLKRSKVAPVHYCYVFHSLVSTHMIYSKTAFWHYDSLLCVGPHHLAELQASQQLYNLKPRQLVEGGYARLDTILAQGQPPLQGPPQLLLAPSWGPNCILESCGHQLIRELLGAEVNLVVRPHPVTVKKHPQLISSLRQEFSPNPRFRLETDVASSDSLRASHVMVSDWSGAALEFAFGLLRPVLFIDVPRKINNPDYQKLSLEPIEASLRAQLGALSPLQGAGLAARDLCANLDSWRESLTHLRQQTVFNVGRFGEVGGEFIDKVASS